MTENILLSDDFETDETSPSPEELASALSKLEERCKSSGIKFIKKDPPYDDEEDELNITLEFKAGRETKSLYIWYYHQILHLLTTSFEDYTFINRYNAICSYKSGTIEASIRPANRLNPKFALSKLFSVDRNEFSKQYDNLALKINSDKDGPVKFIEISKPTTSFSAIASKTHSQPFTIKITTSGINQHDQSLEILEKYGNAILFQIDLLLGLPFIIETLDNRFHPKRKTKQSYTLSDIQFPHSEYDSAPISLYWYARSASDMPLLQYLAFYQVVEYYYPTYSQAEAHRKIKSILKDPAFRYDKDSDIGRLLTSIQISRSGGFGDERTQLKATINECVSEEQLRDFLSSDPNVISHFTSKNKQICSKKINLDSQADIRTEVADRIYEIRCKIVHTKIDSKSETFEQLLPFSKEANSLYYDIDLISFIAQQTLISASSPIHPHG